MNFKALVKISECNQKFRIFIKENIEMKATVTTVHTFVTMTIYRQYNPFVAFQINNMHTRIN